MRHYLRTFGSTVLSDAFGVATPITPREAAFLTYLRRSRQPATRDNLVDLFWPHVSEDRARHSLSQLLYALRSRYPKLGIATSLNRIAITDLDVDVVALENAIEANKPATAISLYKGRFLPDDASLSSTVRSWRDDIEEGVANAISDLLEEQSYTCGMSELHAVVNACETILEVHPHLISAQTALLEASRRLGMTARVKSLHRRFTSSDTHHGTELPPIDSFLTPGTAAAAPHTISFIGRKDELSQLQTYWSKAVAGDGQVVILTGEPGIGKTRLADQFLRRVAIRGGRVWVASCCAATQRLPYSVTHDLLRSNAPGIADRWFPSTTVSAGRSVDEAQPDNFRYRLTEAITSTIVEQAAVQPIAVLVDDAQWADEYTALLLSYWSYRLRAERVLILLTVRTQEAEPPPSWVFSDLGSAVQLQVGRLSVAAATDMVDAFERTNNVSLGQAIRDAALWQSGGRPFLLMEVLASSSSDGAGHMGQNAILSESAESLLVRRFRNLPESAHRLVGVLSVWGQPISATSLQKLSNLSDSDFVSSLNILHERGIAQIHNADVSFPHDLMRETAYRTLLPGTRIQFHRLVANQIASSGGPDALIAQHLAAACDTTSTGQHALAAARAAIAENAYSDYEYYCRLAIRWGSRDDQATAAGMLIRHMIQVGRISDIDEFVGLLAEQEGEYRVLKAISDLERDLAKGERSASDLLELATSIVADEEATFTDPATTALTTTLLCVALDACAGEIDSSEIFRSIPSQTSANDAHLQLEAVLAIWHGVARNAAEGLAMAQSALERMSATASLTTQSSCHYSVGTLMLIAGQVGRARSHFETALTLAQRSGDARREQSIHINHGVVLMELGNPALAREYFERALTTSNVHFRIRCFTNLAILHYESGERALARQAAEAVQTMNASYKSPTIGTTSSAILGLLALGDGDLKMAATHESQIGAVEWAELDDASYTATFLSRMLILAGMRDSALALLQSTIERTRLRDVLCGLRLQCEVASILADSQPDAAYLILKSVLAQASGGGARRIYDRASEIMISLAR